MKKDEKKRHPRGASASRDVVRDWQPLFERLQDAINWALDIAKALARDYDEEFEAIERVRGYVRAWLEGRRVDIDMNDVLTTLAIAGSKAVNFVASAAHAVGKVANEAGKGLFSGFGTPLLIGAGLIGLLLVSRNNSRHEEA